jgi:iron complex transport system substrate-binding protein
MKGNYLLLTVLCLLSLASPLFADVEEFNQKYKDTLTVYGNADMNDLIDENDIQYVKGIISGTKEKTQFADANNDGIISEDDITQIEQIIAGNADKIHILDMTYRTVTVPMPVERIVSASRMDSTRTLIQLGAQDKIVGGPFPGSKFTTSSVKDAAPELEGLPDPGSFNEINVEQVLALKPDVMFVVTSVDADMIQDQTRVPTIAVADAGDLWTTDMIRIIGSVTGKDEKARELIAYTKEKIGEITKITSEIPDSEKPVVYNCGPGGGSGELLTVCKSSIDKPMVERAGGLPVEGAPESKPGGTEVSKEQIIKWNPDVITIHGGNQKEIDAILADSDLKSVNAIKNKKVYSLQVAQNGGAILGEKLAQVGYLAKLLHPDKFNDLNVEKEGNEIMKYIYGVDGLYTNMVNAYDLYRW